MDGYSLSISICHFYRGTFLFMAWLQVPDETFEPDRELQLRTAAFITFIIALGTNIIFFAIIEDSMSSRLFLCTDFNVFIL
jgi:hypothetical protein